MSEKFLILMFYYNRPEMVKAAMRSVIAQEGENWELAIIDDGSEIHVGEIVKEVFGETDRVKIYRIDDTAEEKFARNGVNGSMMGKYANDAIAESNADYVVILCDDDALYANYLSNLRQWFSVHPSENYVYSHIKWYNPTVEKPEEPMEKRPHSLNKTDAICPFYAIDWSQIGFRRKVVVDDGIKFPFPYTVNIDAEFMLQMHTKWGNVSYSGFISQYKATYTDSLSHRMGQVVGGHKDAPSVYIVGVK